MLLAFLWDRHGPCITFYADSTHYNPTFLYPVPVHWWLFPWHGSLRASPAHPWEGGRHKPGHHRIRPTAWPWGSWPGPALTSRVTQESAFVFCAICTCLRPPCKPTPAPLSLSGCRRQVIWFQLDKWPSASHSPALSLPSSCVK